MNGIGKRKTRRPRSRISIDVQLRDARWKALLSPYRKTVRATCEAALAMGIGNRESGIGKTSVTIVLANDAFVRELNRDFRGLDKPTNVLSFPDSRFPIPDSRLGDIVLARQTVEREAKAQGKTVKAHAAHLLVHGTLHLLGHDHERKKDAEKMEALEIKILKKLGISNPYLWKPE